jgi:HlyD family secretion protein
MPATVRVDAFQDESFAGTVTQIRFNPTETQGVVTYAAVIDVKNEELKLRPGMTASITIRTSAVKGVPAIRNAALRFKPKNLEGIQPANELSPGQRRVFALEASADPAKAKAVPRTVQIGITDGAWTELRGEPLASGVKLVTEERSTPKEGRTKFLGVF